MTQNFHFPEHSQNNQQASFEENMVDVPKNLLEPDGKGNESAFPPSAREGRILLTFHRKGSALALYE